MATARRKTGSKAPSSKATKSKTTTRKLEKKAAAAPARAKKNSAKRSASAPPAKKRAARAKCKPQVSPVEVDGEVLEFIEAIDQFKKEANRPFPSWSEVLHVLKSLGYRR